MQGIMVTGTMVVFVRTLSTPVHALIDNASLMKSKQTRSNVPGAPMLLTARWARNLTDELRRRVVAETKIRSVPAGGYVCRKGDRVEHWIGVLGGLVKIASVSPEGKSVSFIGVPSGGWFGEGSLLKDEPRRYDGIALRDSTVAYMPRNTFMLLLDSSVAFNRFLLVQLNERLGQFVAMVEYDRLLGPDARLARELAGLFNPLLYPGGGDTLPVSQEELAHLVGLSRQRVNQALRRLEQSGLVRVGYRGVTLLDFEGLRRFEG